MRQEDLKLKVDLTYTGRSFLTSKVGVWGVLSSKILLFLIQHKAQTGEKIQRLEALAALTENPVCIPMFKAVLFTIATKTQKQLRLLNTG